MALTIEQIKLVGIGAYAIEQRNEYVTFFAYHPRTATVSSVTVHRTGSTSRHERTPPVSGWQHVPACDCQFCTASHDDGGC